MGQFATLSPAAHH